MKKVLIIIAQEGYQDHEFAGTRDGFAVNGYEIVIASKHAGPCKGKLGGAEQASVTSPIRLGFVPGREPEAMPW